MGSDPQCSSVHWLLLQPLSTDRNCCLESKSTCFGFLHVLPLEYPVLDGWRTKTLGRGSLLDFKCFRLFIAKRAGLLGWIGPGFSCSSPEYRGHSGGPVDISILGRGGWNLEAEEHLALLPWMCTFLGVLWLSGSVLNGYKSIVTLRVNHWRGLWCVCTAVRVWCLWVVNF